MVVCTQIFACLRYNFCCGLAIRLWSFAGLGGVCFGGFRFWSLRLRRFSRCGGRHNCGCFGLLVRFRRTVAVLAAFRLFGFRLGFRRLAAARAGELHHAVLGEDRGHAPVALRFYRSQH